MHDINTLFDDNISLSDYDIANIIITALKSNKYKYVIDDDIIMIYIDSTKTIEITKTALCTLYSSLNDKINEVIQID